MESGILKIVGQIAGIGGLALGVLLIIFRDVLRQKIFPTFTREHGYRIIRLIIVFTFLIAVLGIIAWFLQSRNNAVEESKKSSVTENQPSPTNTPSQNIIINISQQIKEAKEEQKKIPIQSSKTAIEREIVPKSNNNEKQSNPKDTSIDCGQITEVPMTACLNCFPVTYSSPAEFCHDYSLVDARIVDGGKYSKNAEDWENGLDAKAGDEIYVLIFLNNGVADNAEESERIAKNVQVTTLIDTNQNSVHSIKVTAKGDNTNTAEREFKIITAENKGLEIIRESGEIYDYRGKMPPLLSTLDIGNNTMNVGNIKGNFRDSIFVRFKLKVV